LPVWFGLFLGNAVLALNEQMPLYALGNTRTSDVSVYFSPSCPACREAILSLGNSAALYPVEEKEGDVESILRLAALLKVNVPLREALPRSLNKEEPVPYIPFYERALLSLHLLRNKASLLRQGFRAVPLIRINGMPGQAATSLDRAAAQRQDAGRPSNPGAAAASGQSADPIYPLSPSLSGPGASGQAPGQGGPDAFSAPRTERPSGSGAMGERGLPDFLQAPEDLSRCGGADAPPCR
jgi:thiol-disulfide isomerase/thioredoxin